MILKVLIITYIVCLKNIIWNESVNNDRYCMLIRGNKSNKDFLYINMHLTQLLINKRVVELVFTIPRIVCKYLFFLLL